MIFRGRRAVGTALVVVALLAGSTSACGDGDEDDVRRDSVGLEAAAAKARPSVPPPPPASEKASPRWSNADWGAATEATTTGLLVTSDGEKIRGWGDRRVRRYVTALFRRMQHDFMTGKMAPVCEHIDSLLLSFITKVAFDASCETKLRRYAQQLENRRFKPSPLRFLWVRTYPGVAGIWVEDSHGKRFRVPFVQEHGNRWDLELALLTPPEALAMPLQVKRPASRPTDLAAAASKTPPVVPPPPPASDTVSPRWSNEHWGGAIDPNSKGMLVTPDGDTIRGWGDPRVRRHVTALFRRMQHDFLTGDMAPICERVDSPLVAATSAPPGAPCEKTLSSYAQDLEKRRFKPSPLRFLWVRAYPGIAGIWVEDSRGKRFRVPFVQEDGSGWKLRLVELAPPEALAMPLQLKRPASR